MTLGGANNENAAELGAECAGGVDCVAVVPGIYVSGPAAALIAALAIGFINATVGVVLKILTFL